MDVAKGGRRGIHWTGFRFNKENTQAARSLIGGVVSNGVVGVVQFEETGGYISGRIRAINQGGEGG